MSEDQDPSPTIDYANPIDLPPPDATATIQMMEGDTVVIVPPASRAQTTIGWVVAALLCLWPVVIANEYLFHKKVSLGDRLIFTGVCIGTLVVFCLAGWQLWRNARFPTVIRASARTLLVVRPRLIFGRRTWQAADIRPLSVSLGTPAVNGKIISDLRVGSWAANNRILARRDKAELLWIARMVNRAMGKA